jgi:hypothetical protein
MRDAAESDFSALISNPCISVVFCSGRGLALKNGANRTHLDSRL